MKYSLRSLFVVVTLVAVVLGGRIEYLRRWAVFHEREARPFAQAIAQENRLPNDQIDYLLAPDYPWPPKFDEKYRSYDRHRKLTAEYRAACYRPWMVIREPEPLPLD